MKPGADGPNRAAKCRCCFLVAHFLELAQNHHFAVVFRQRANRLPDPPDILNGSKLVPAWGGGKSTVAVSISMAAVPANCGLRSGAAGGRVAEVAGIAVERHQPPVLLPAFPHVIARDAKKESAQGSASRIKSLGIANQRHKNLLGHVLSHSRIPGHVQGEAVDCGVLLPINLRKSVFISPGHPSQQKGVREIGRLSHRYLLWTARFASRYIFRHAGTKVPKFYSGNGIQPLPAQILAANPSIRVLDQRLAVK